MTFNQIIDKYYIYNNEHLKFLKQNYFGSLNGIRAICALAVIQIHCGLVLGGASFPKLFNQGYLGVDMFFTISGYLIVTLLIRERQKSSEIDLKAFYIRRTLRIFPIYYLLIAITFLFYFSISPWKPNGLNYYSDAFPVLLTYTQNIFIINMGIFFHCWSLAMEEQFYLVWPWIEKYFPFGMRVVAILLVLVVSQLFNFGYFNDWLNHVYNNNEAYQKPMYLITFTPIILGVALAYVLNNRYGYFFMRLLVGGRAAALVLFLILILIRELLVANFFYHQGIGKLLTHVTMMFLLASLVVREDHFCKAILQNKVLSYLGKISYGLYLYHVAILSIVVLVFNRFGSVASPLLLFTLTSLITIFVAHLSYNYFEAPIMKQKNSLYNFFKVNKEVVA